MAKLTRYEELALKALLKCQSLDEVETEFVSGMMDRIVAEELNSIPHTQRVAIWSTLSEHKDEIRDPMLLEILEQIEAYGDAVAYVVRSEAYKYD